MPGYFQTLAALKSAIRDTKQELREWKESLQHHQSRVEEYRNILSKPELNRELNDPLFQEAERIKQQAYWNLGESKYRVHQTGIEIRFTQARLRFYKSHIKKLIV